MNNPLGRIRNHDERSRQFTYPTKRSTSPYRTVTHRMDNEHLDQFYLSACVGFSGAQLLNCRIAAKSRHKSNMVSHLWKTPSYQNNNDGINFYTRSTQFDQFDWTYPPEDGGSSALGLMQYWKRFGIIGGYRWAFSFDAMLSALQNQPVLVGTDWYSGMTVPYFAKRSRWLAIPQGTPQGGHEYLANGVNMAEKLIRCEQSWGENVDGATFYIAFEHMEWLLSRGGDVAIPELL